MEDMQILTGIQPVTEALRHRRRPLYRLLLSRKTGTREITGMAEAAGIKVFFKGTEELSRLAGSGKHQGAVLECGPLPEYDVEDLLRFEPPSGNDLLLLVCGVEDPRNLGAIARCCSFQGVRAILVPGRAAAPVSPAASRTSAGALESLPVCRVSSVISACRRISSSGFEVTGVELSGEPINSWTQVASKNLIVMGGEDRGIPVNLRRECDRLVSIPGSGTVGSLNVSVASGIVLYHISLNQLKGGG